MAADRIARLRSVDVHTHIGLPAIEETVAGAPGLRAQRALEARRMGPDAIEVNRRMIADIGPKLSIVDVRLADMDAAGIDIQVVSPSPVHYHSWCDEALAERVWQLANAGVAEFCRQRPERFVGLGLAPLQHGDQALDALEHAVRECGLRGVEIPTHALRLDGSRPVELSDERLERFWAAAERLEAVVFVHPLGCTLDERLDRWYLSNVVGNPVESAVALSHVILSGVLDRHPNLRLLASHGGGYLPTYIGRADHAWLNRGDVHRCADRPSAYLRRLWFDSLVHDPRVLRSLVATVGADRVLIGSDYPFDMGVPDPVERLLEADLGDEATVAIARTNAARLGLAPPV